MDICVVVKRYDQPDRFGFHYYTVDLTNRDGFRSTRAPFLLDGAKKEGQIKNLFQMGFKKDLTPYDNMHPTMRRIVKRSCPIEFHDALRNSDPHLIRRITVLTKST